MTSLPEYIRIYKWAALSQILGEFYSKIEFLYWKRKYINQKKRL
jgi:hypothetical protein